ncbi:hypothetical protein GRJ2_000477800 [Grus japonensis]|uniref:Uncharacterized protein n=1 Tax=Grus japonensis TaxID=30415 RepID=A0ABC9W3Z5_GRUJA
MDLHSNKVPDKEFTCDPFCLEPTNPPHGTSSTITAVVDSLFTSTEIQEQVDIQDPVDSKASNAVGLL